MRTQDRGLRWDVWYGAIVVALVNGIQSALVVNHRRRQGREFPKGGRNDEDNCPYGTALRELDEESSLDVGGAGKKHHFWVDSRGHVTSAAQLASRPKSGWLVFRHDGAPTMLDPNRLHGYDINNDPRFLPVSQLVGRSVYDAVIKHPQQYALLTQLLTLPEYQGLWTSG